MKRIALVVVPVLMILAACSDDSAPNSGATAPPQSETQTSSQQASAVSSERVSEPSSAVTGSPPIQREAETIDNETHGFLLDQLEMSEYDKYMDAEILPSIDELKAYLEKVILYHDAEIIGDVELWALDRGESIYEIRHTQLVTYPVMDGGKELLWGVDRNTGIVYSWSNDTKTVQPDILESPEIFPTPLSALEYVKNNHWDSSQRFIGQTESFDLELFPGNEDSELNNQLPYYSSQPITFDDTRTATYLITIDRVDEQSYIIHSYSVVMDSPEEGHTATTSWLRVNKNGFIVDEIVFNRWIAAEAM